MLALLGTFAQMNVSSAAGAQPAQSWVGIYDIPEQVGGATRVATDDAGNVYVTGIGPDGFNSDIITIKYTSAGTVSPGWPVRYQGPLAGPDAPTGIAVDSQDNVYVAGRTWQARGGGLIEGDRYDGVLIKYDADGVVQWVRIYAGAGEGDDQFKDLVIDAADNVYVCGYTFTAEGSPGNNSSDLLTIKYQPNGDFATGWPQVRDNLGTAQYAEHLALDGLGDVCVTGTFSTSEFTQTVKYSTSGGLRWDRFFTGPGPTASFSTNSPEAIAADAAGNVYVTGVFADDIMTLKYDAAGALSPGWPTYFAGTVGQRDLGFDVTLDGTGSVYVAGQIGSGDTVPKLILLKYAPGGALQWSNAYQEQPPTSQDRSYLGIGADNAVYVTTDHGINYVTTGFDPDGTVTWREFQTGGHTAGIATSANGSFTVAGTLRFPSRYLTIQYSPAGASAAPDANDDTYSTWKNCPKRLAVLANDTSGAGGALTPAIDDAPDHGAAVVNADGTISYTPATGYVGPDAFTYHVTEGSSPSEPATVTLTVQDDTLRPTGTVGTVVVQSPTRVYVPVTAMDGQSGVASVQLTGNSRNCTLEDPAGNSIGIGGTLHFDPAVGSVVLKAVKANPAQAARVELRLTDCSGNTLLTDPVIANLEVRKKQLSQTFRRIPAAEHYLEIQNGTPGLTDCKLWINGKLAYRGDLTDGQLLSLDIVRWMGGRNNTVRISASGPAGATAVLLIGDESMQGSRARPSARQVEPTGARRFDLSIAP
jgi:hypothetical protein